jgi:predicted HicB family RNase H-like nuclease
VSDPVFEQDIDMEIRLPWPKICKLAVKARCLGVSLNDVVEHALIEAVEIGRSMNRSE